MKLKSEASVVVSMNVFVLDIDPPRHYRASGKDQFKMF